MYIVQSGIKQVLNMRWYKSVDDDKYYLEQFVRTIEYMMNDDPNCPLIARRMEIPKDEWVRVPYILEGVGEVTP